jgi:hypothetical protein
MRSSNTANVSSKRRSICARRSSAVTGPPPEPEPLLPAALAAPVEPPDPVEPVDPVEPGAPAVPGDPADPVDLEPCGCPRDAPEPLEGTLLPVCPSAPVDDWPAGPWPSPSPLVDRGPWLPPLLEVLPGMPLAPPLLPPCVCCGGNGDSLPLLDGLELGLPLVLVLPPDVDGNGDGVEGAEEPGGCGSDGGEGICVEVLEAQPARPSAQATGQTRPRT